MTDTSLPGGAVNAVTRVGATVRRPLPPRAGYIHDLLTFLAQQGWDGAPRPLGVDEHGRQVLTYLPGHVAWAPGQLAAVISDASLSRVAGLVRQLHDLTAGTHLAGGCEVVCHNDLAPKNTVYRDLGAGMRPVAFIDWDLAGPGERIHDVAHVCWQFVGLGPAVAAPSEAARRIGLIRDAYGLRRDAPLIETVLWWQDRCWRGIEAGARAGDPAARRLRDAGAVDEVRASQQWVCDHREQLT